MEGVLFTTFHRNILKLVVIREVHGSFKNDSVEKWLNGSLTGPLKKEIDFEFLHGQKLVQSSHDQ